LSWDHELAVEVAEEEKEDEEAGRTADIKPTNPHFTGGEKNLKTTCYCIFFIQT
jgi:hypothetical protein